VKIRSPRRSPTACGILTARRSFPINLEVAKGSRRFGENDLVAAMRFLFSRMKLGRRTHRRGDRRGLHERGRSICRTSGVCGRRRRVRRTRELYARLLTESPM
jgi:hypothetical protein